MGKEYIVIEFEFNNYDGKHVCFENFPERLGEIMKNVIVLKRYNVAGWDNAYKLAQELEEELWHNKT
ncbi:hypothetical protein COV15_02470 [Candidatus Woesearchaeota archaeon CG10_big_fil_rev_8_21_14_0_10_34_12]|nr:MAG: hypothetical protein COV15_02470 [Candidatus Woesearchaeota archaeon CG10_big_fil_rev_8_21_14_0_10_34_12]